MKQQTADSSYRSYFWMLVTTNEDTSCIWLATSLYLFSVFSDKFQCSTLKSAKLIHTMIIWSFAIMLSILEATISWNSSIILPTASIVVCYFLQLSFGNAYGTSVSQVKEGSELFNLSQLQRDSDELRCMWFVNVSHAIQFSICSMSLNTSCAVTSIMNCGTQTGEPDEWKIRRMTDTM
jgi:hypothetical protein